MVDRSNLDLSLRRQCQLLGVHRSGLYYKARGESKLNLELMRLIDEHYLDHPYKGARRMHTWLKYDLDYQVSQNRIDRLYYRIMGLRSLLPGPHTSKRNKAHKVYPYLLRGLKVTRPNQVWQMDLTYVAMPRGFMYLTAIIDVHSRYIVGWNLSNTMDTESCTDVLIEAVETHGAPEILNTDQGSQFTSEHFTGYVSKLYGTRLSMDGKGRATDNAYIERFWRTIKYEHIYLNPTDNTLKLYCGIRDYIIYYNGKQRQKNLAQKTPHMVYFQAA